MGILALLKCIKIDNFYGGYRDTLFLEILLDNLGGLYNV